MIDDSDAAGALANAIRRNDAAAVREAIACHPALRGRINDPLPGLPFDTMPIHGAVSRENREMIDTLLEAGANIDVRSAWWAGGFGVLDFAARELVPFLIDRGATIDAHAAARLGMTDRLEELLALDPGLVHARGGDGQTPLHMASTVEIARLLLDHGAVLDALDIDHESTPAQYMLADRQDVARFLVDRGARTDILMAAALGDLARVRNHLDENPDAVHTSVSDRYFPKRNPKSGGTIYNWVLGTDKTAHIVARDFGREDVFRELMRRTPPAMTLAVACELGDETLVKETLRTNPELARTLTLAPDVRRKLVCAARDNNTSAVRLMLAAGWPADATGQHGGTALHWAAWHGNVEMIREVLKHNPPIDQKDHDHGGTALGWAIHASTQGWHPDKGDYPATVATLLDAGAAPPGSQAATGASEAVRQVLRSRSIPGS